MRTQVKLDHPKFSAAVISFGVLAFSYFAFILAGDLFKAPIWFDRPYSGFANIAYYIVYPLDAFFVVGLFAVPLLIWHLFDAIDQDRDGSREPFLMSYRTVLACLIAGMIGAGIVLSGLTAWLSCYRPESVVTDGFGNSFGFWCTPNPAYLIEFLVLPFALALVFLTFLKFGHVIRRRIV